MPMRYDRRKSRTWGLAAWVLSSSLENASCHVGKPVVRCGKIGKCELRGNFARGIRLAFSPIPCSSVKRRRCRSEPISDGDQSPGQIAISSS